MGTVVLELEPTYSATGVPLIPFPVAPVAPVLATANENFLFIVIPSTTTGIVASHAALIVAVVLNVTLTFEVPLFSTVALIPVGHTMSAAVTATEVH